MLRLASHRFSLGLINLHHFTTVVMAALGANSVGHAGLTAIRAQRSLGCAQGIVRATFVATSFRMSSFWIWHNYSVLGIGDCRLPIWFDSNQVFQIGNRQSAILSL
jgi:hypothetical protein